jgi:hypothetical protein
LNPRPLGYEPHDIRLPRLGQSPVTVLASTDLRREVLWVYCVSLVSVRPAASGLQIGLQKGS